MDDPYDWLKASLSLCDAPIVNAAESDLDGEHPAILFKSYWEKLNGGSAPSVERFRPSEAVFALKWLLIFERREEADGHHFFLKLVGTAAETLMNDNFSGRYLEEFTAGNCYSSRQTLLSLAGDGGVPIFGRLHLGEESEFRAAVTVGMFPFTAGGGKLAQVYVVVAPTRPEQRVYL